MRIAETPWILCDGSADLRVLEATFRDRVDGKVSLILIPTQPPAERQISLRVQKILTAAGPVTGT